MKFVAQLKACLATAHVLFVTLHLLIVFACGAFHSNAFGQILGTASLNVERRGHTATLLQDGKVLIVGGENQSGVVGEAEIFEGTS